MNSKRTIVIGMLALLAIVLAACGGSAASPAGPAGPAGPTGPAGSAAEITCSDCHNDTTTLIAKQAQWAGSGHGTGTSFGYAGGRADCTACHSGEGFAAMLAAGVAPGENESGVTNPTGQTCRTCHEIHTTYTGDDWALATTDAVTLIASGETFDGGQGNLCATCHQPRKAMNEAVDGMVEVGSHWGPHHGVEAAMLLGQGGAGVEGTPAAHATMVADTCVSCHVGDDDDHSFEPSVAACTGCHVGAEDFDIHGAQTEIAALAAEVAELLEAKGLMHDGHAVEGVSYPEAEATALWNYIFAVVEDTSGGVHNPAYTKALLELALAGLQ